MSFIKSFPKASWRLAKIAVGVVVLTGLAVGTIAYAQAKPLPTVEKVELDKYLGVWYEVARKPMFFERKCAFNVTATYTLNENGNIVVDNKCADQDGDLQQSLGEAFVVNAPFNSKLKVSFLPEGVRWIPVGRGDYWILKLDEDYQTVLVGEPRRKYLWVLSRIPNPKKEIIHEYLNYAKSWGYDIHDVIYPEHR
ncbi:lipocalin family protein [Acinetobacter parvus]|uniref:lipocalin family protein n=1 Tax=Acinetobacter parvus TaxID=134533 RepID=UPI0021D216E7|nr:lipocalin family protein [Acinetobacter parvus]MCU4394516.1 lipocalin family protein [Acinetobacter parvus]